MGSLLPTGNLDDDKSTSCCRNLGYVDALIIEAIEKKHRVSEDSHVSAKPILFPHCNFATPVRVKQRPSFAVF